MDFDNDHIKLAWEYVENTNQNIFLTGNAGTGKTTLLKYIKLNSKKNIVVAAPTGVAAINAGGVTLHSLFQIPFGMFIPNGMVSDVNNFITPSSLRDRFRLSKIKQDVIRNIDLLIIDEVSMVRADLLDMVDLILKFTRASAKPFGGVQVLFIGDLYQLPPVLQDDQKDFFYNSYETEFFFSAKVLKSNPPIGIRLEKIYRQKNGQFIEILNAIRHNTIDGDQLEILNRRYSADLDLRNLENFILLSTHNFKVDKINQQKLASIEAEVINFEAIVENDFPESMWPTGHVLELKVGAQVMFIKNDTETPRRYFNGKIGVVESIDYNDKKVEVLFQNGDSLDVSYAEWNNIEYKLNAETQQLEEHIKGVFRALPLKCAWAITIHKSQGLTFEEAIIDAGQSFSSGQVYVALSRCKTLEGITMISPIQKEAIFSNPKVVEFDSSIPNIHTLNTNLESYKTLYLQDFLLQLFNFEKDFTKIIKDFHGLKMMNLNFTKEDLETFESISNRFAEVLKISSGFVKLIPQYFESNSMEALYEKVTNASAYFSNFFANELIIPISQMGKGWAVKSGFKTAFKVLLPIKEQLNVNLNKISKIQFLPFLDIDNRATYMEVVNQISDVKTKTEPSHLITLNLINQNKSLEDTAKERNLEVSTIESHIVKCIEEGLLKPTSFITTEVFEDIKFHFEKNGINSGMTEVFTALDRKYTYGQLRMVKAFILKSMNT